MDFNLNEDQLMFKETARRFAEVEIAPRIAEMEERQRTSPAVMEKMRSLDFYRIQYPVAYGGIGSSFLEYCLVMEEISRVYCSIGGHLAVNNLCAGTIHEFGTEEQKKKYLPSLLTGGAVGSFAFTEPDTGTDPAAIKTTAVRDGNDWIINGRKIFITNATLPGYAVVFCKDTELDGKITNIIVPKDAPGFSTGKHYEKMGMHGMEVTDIILENVRVPFENTTGGEKGRGLGFKILTQIIATGKLSISAQCVGMAQAALDEAVKYARSRTQRGKAIGNFQTIQWIIGEMAAEVEAARYMLYATACAKSQGSDILVESARTRLFVSQVAHRAVSGAMQVMGAFGYMKEFPIERIFRDMKLAELYEGVNEIQRVISAAALLR
jgi:butyryl-CoA dehydrogenase